MLYSEAREVQGKLETSGLHGRAFLVALLAKPKHKLLCSDRLQTEQSPDRFRQ